MDLTSDIGMPQFAPGPGVAINPACTSRAESFRIYISGIFRFVSASAGNC